MINIVIVEDENSAADLLTEHLKRYAQESKECFNIDRYSNALDFLSNYKTPYDIVFMDIQMPNMNGMESAFRLREIDKQVVLIFVTSMTQFAIRGYEVDALNYIIKPVQYEKLAFVLQKAIHIVKTNEEVELTVMQNSGVIRLSSKDIYYIEVRGHKLFYHIGKEIVQSYGSLTDLEKVLKSRNFMRCNNCYLVNPKHIESVRGYDILMRNGDYLKISQPKRKDFMNDLTNWLGKGNFN